MKKEEFYVLNGLYNGSRGRAACTADIDRMKVLKNPEILNSLIQTRYVSKTTGGITEEGLAALEPYRVKMRSF